MVENIKNEFVAKLGRSRYERVECADGFSMSVQAHGGAYCEPREDDGRLYSQVEIGYPNEAEPLLKEYAEQWTRRNDKGKEECYATKTVYGYVPARLVMDVIVQHGGIVGGELPPLKFT